VIVVHPLDRLARTVRDTLNMIHELSERGIGVRNLADRIKIDSTHPEDPMAQLAVVLLALFAQMEPTYTMERAAHASRRGRGKGSSGRPAGTRRRRKVGVGGALARPGENDRGDRQEDRDPAHQPVPPPPAATGAGRESGRRSGPATRRVVSARRAAPD
jgi:DNA invertase Pin-like site-specific DNA recombinase